MGQLRGIWCSASLWYGSGVYWFTTFQPFYPLFLQQYQFGKKEKLCHSLIPPWGLTVGESNLIQPETYSILALACHNLISTMQITLVVNRTKSIVCRIQIYPPIMPAQTLQQDYVRLVDLELTLKLKVGSCSTFTNTCRHPQDILTFWYAFVAFPCEELTPTIQVVQVPFLPFHFTASFMAIFTSE